MMVTHGAWCMRVHSLQDKTHPCIIMWSMGNEAGHGPALDAAAAYLRAKDPSRPIHYEVGHCRGHSQLGIREPNSNSLHVSGYLASDYSTVINQFM
jgi:beta-galactosidase/beta-glucuronidase